MAAAWRSAADDLGLHFESPFGISYRGQTYWCTGLLLGFGCPAGTVIVGPESTRGAFAVAEAAGYHATELSPYPYETYDPERFMDTLDEWGWFARPAEAPRWFAGGFKRRGGAP
jgi:hypothetical protein